jgi:hypothetical protein
MKKNIILYFTIIALHNILIGNAGKNKIKGRSKSITRVVKSQYAGVMSPVHQTQPVQGIQAVENNQQNLSIRTLNGRPNLQVPNPNFFNKPHNASANQQISHGTNVQKQVSQPHTLANQMQNIYNPNQNIQAPAGSAYQNYLNQMPQAVTSQQNNSILPLQQPSVTNALSPQQPSVTTAQQNYSVPSQQQLSVTPQQNYYSVPPQQQQPLYNINPIPGSSTTPIVQAQVYS